MEKEALEIIQRIGNERNIDVEVLVDALEAALVSASKKMLGNDVKVSRAIIDREEGNFKVFAYKTVVDELEYPEDEILLEDARKIEPDCVIGDSIEVDVTPEDFGRIAAQSAKQVVTQRIREAERVVIHEKFKDRVGELIYGTVQRYEKRDVIVDIGVTEAILKHSEKAFGERYRYGDKIRAIIQEVQESAKEPQVVLSRRSPEFLVKLFHNEVPEISEGIVSIKAVAREAGKRSKIAVSSSDPSVDPVGACVGVKGSRVQMVVQELRGERIDIVEFSNDARRFVGNALKPAEVSRVDLIEDEEGRAERATLVVRDDQLSLAIGKGGLNANLASRLTGVPIDIVSEAELSESEEAMREELLILDDVDDLLADALMSEGIFSVEDILDVGLEGLMEVPNMEEEKAQSILDNAEELIRLAIETQEEEELAESDEESEASISVEEVEGLPGEESLAPSAGVTETADETEEEKTS